MADENEISRTSRRKALQMLGTGSLSVVGIGSLAGTAAATHLPSNEPLSTMSDNCYVYVDSPMGKRYDWRRDHAATLSYWGATWEPAKEPNGRWEHTFVLHGSAWGEERAPGFHDFGDNGHDWNQAHDMFDDHSILIEDGAPNLNVTSPTPLDSSSHHIDIGDQSISATPAPNGDDGGATAVETIVEASIGELVAPAGWALDAYDVYRALTPKSNPNTWENTWDYTDNLSRFDHHVYFNIYSEPYMDLAFQIRSEANGNPNRLSGVHFEFEGETPNYWGNTDGEKAPSSLDHQITTRDHGNAGPDGNYYYSNRTKPDNY